mgnify:CR=1 FL=1|tara:strand:- start:923 stop:1153 length:231 start_codon:yes stop_codon:yes gene_type:complete
MNIDYELTIINKIDTAIALYHVFEDKALKGISNHLHTDIIEASNSLDQATDLFDFDRLSNIREAAINIFNKYKSNY